MILWPARTALRPPMPWAVVSRDAVERAERWLDALSDADHETRRAGADLSESQPALAAALDTFCDETSDEVAEALVRVLLPIVVRSFADSFGERLPTLDAGALRDAAERLTLDASMRRDDPHDPLDTDDVVALAQPALVAYVREQFEHTIATPDDESPEYDIDAIDAAHDLLLTAIVALGDAVNPPARLAATASRLS